MYFLNGIALLSTTGVASPDQTQDNNLYTQGKQISVWGLRLRSEIKRLKLNNNRELITELCYTKLS